MTIFFANLAESQDATNYLLGHDIIFIGKPAHGKINIEKLIRGELSPEVIKWIDRISKMNLSNKKYAFFFTLDGARKLIYILDEDGNFVVNINGVKSKININDIIKKINQTQNAP